MKQLLLISLFYFLLVGSYAQVDSIASIKSMLANEQSDSITLELLDKLSLYYTTNSNDSANYYNQQMVDLAKRAKNPNAEVEAISRLARSKYISGYTSDALKFALNGLELAIELNDTYSEFINLRQIMWIYGDVENYPKRLEYAQKLRVMPVPKPSKIPTSQKLH